MIKFLIKVCKNCRTNSTEFESNAIKFNKNAIVYRKNCRISGDPELFSSATEPVFLCLKESPVNIVYFPDADRPASGKIGLSFCNYLSDIIH